MKVKYRGKPKAKPRCIVIAGPNGAGKTTFAQIYLRQESEIIHFVNADLIAAGLSPLNPSFAALRAGRLVLREIDRFSKAKVSFAFESTLSGRTYLRRLRRIKQLGYRVEIVFVRIATPKLALRRIAIRVKQEGHSVPKRDVLRRFGRSWSNFLAAYRELADSWAVYDNSGTIPVLIERQHRRK